MLTMKNKFQGEHVKFLKVQYKNVLIVIRMFAVGYKKVQVL